MVICNRIYRTHSETLLEIEAEVQLCLGNILDSLVCV